MTAKEWFVHFVKASEETTLIPIGISLGLIVVFLCTRGTKPKPKPKPKAMLLDDEFQQYVQGKAYLDESRLACLKRHRQLIHDLMDGELRGRNRFRELLLGTKACGKSTMLEILRDYTSTYFPLILTATIVMSADEGFSIVDFLLQRIKETFPDRYTQGLKKLENSQDHVFRRVELFEAAIVKATIKILRLVDEFHLVYKVPDGKGKQAVTKIANLADTRQGHIHIVVSGSSSTSRKLAFCKTGGLNMSEYPSYAGVDLNSTKLQAQWIFPLRTNSDMHAFFERYPPKDQNRNVDNTRKAELFLLSGGRPGLMRDNSIESSPIFNVQVSSQKSRSVHSILSSIYCTIESFVELAEGDGDDSAVDAILRLVPISTALKTYRERGEFMEENEFEMKCYDLADKGSIIFENNSIGFSCLATYFAVKSSLTESLTWKEAAALKYPSAFDKMAENIALRIIRNNHSELQGLELGQLKGTDSTVLNFGTKKPTFISPTLVHFLSAEPEKIFGYLHKEQFNNHNVAGADAISLRKDGDKSVRVVRFRIKLKKGSITLSEVNKLKLDMEQRGAQAIECIKTKYPTTKVTNVLFTTECFESEDNESFQSDDTFVLFSQVSLAKFWPDDVKMLGRPYASNCSLKNLENYVLSSCGTSSIPTTVSQE